MKTITKIFFVFFSVLLFSCDDILEKDISDEIVSLIYPMSGEMISSNVVNFQWYSINGASSYRVQVFTSNQNVVLDTLVTQNNFTSPLVPGNYQWRVRGENFAYHSPYSINASFSVSITDDLTNQQVILSSPANNFYTNTTTLTFNWQTLNAAETYTFQLVNITNGQTIVDQQDNLSETSIVIDNSIINQDAHYSWKIKAKNTASETQFSERTFYLDRVNPNQPANQLPATNSIQNLNQPINFSWTIAADSGIIQSQISYIIEFSNDSLFSTILQTSAVSSNSFSQSFSATGEYYWRVKAKDLAGNMSNTSTPFKFTIN